MAATYERSSGNYVAERLRPVPGSEEEQRLAQLADDPGSDWRRIADPEPEPTAPPADDGKLPARSASKADWVAYALAHGVDQEAADKATRDELAARFHDGGGS